MSRPENKYIVSQTSETGLGAIIGKWPGNETDEELMAAMEMSQPEIQIKIDELRALKPDWNGYGAPVPTAKAIEAASRISAAMSQRLSDGTEIRPIPDADGGVAVYALGGPRDKSGGSRFVAGIFVSNDDDDYALMLEDYDDSSQSIIEDIKESQLDESIERIARFIRGEK